MVFQNYALYPHMTVFKNMAFALLQQRVPRAEIDRKVRSVATMLQLQDLLERKPAQLSGGQRQRVALGRAIVRNPAAFLFDEPLSNLDAKLRVVTRAELKNLHRELRTTSIYVTHDQEEAMTLADRIVVMDNGVVQQIARPLEIYKRPVNRFVAGFLGMPPMNFIDGRIGSKSDRPTFTTQDFSVLLPAGLGAKADASEVVLGIRPEDLKLQQAETGLPAGWLKGEVLVVEPLGSAMDVHVRTSSGKHLTARVPSDESIQPGMPVVLGFEATTLHLFGPGPYGANLTIA
jgi:multiple sugar transport system ATP-binding protein